MPDDQQLDPISVTLTFLTEVSMGSEPLDRLLTIKQIAAQTGISRSTIYRRIQEGEFPKPVRIGPRATRWPESEIKIWLDELKRPEGS